MVVYHNTDEMTIARFAFLLKNRQEHGSIALKIRKVNAFGAVQLPLKPRANSRSSNNSKSRKGIKSRKRWC